MIDPKVKADTIAHYERMIRWVKTQEPESIPDSLEMADAIKENWFAQYCPICKSVHSDCDECPIGKVASKGCVGTSWIGVNNSLSWREWIVAAKAELGFIKSLE